MYTSTHRLYFETPACISDSNRVKKKNNAPNVVAWNEIAGGQKVILLFRLLYSFDEYGGKKVLQY